MWTYSKEQALEIANRNAIKAIVAGYTAVQDKDDPALWTVTTNRGKVYTLHLHINPEDRAEYYVFCDCPFSGMGFKNCTCKHGEICRQIVDAQYYGDIDREIRETFRQIIKEEEAENYFVTTTGKRYPRPVASSLRVCLNDECEPEQPTRFSYRSISRTTLFGDPAIAKAYAADSELWETFLQE